MAGITKKQGSKFWHATYRDHTGRQRCKSTKETNPSKARRIAEEFERFARRKVPAHRVREAINEVVREHYRTDVPFTTVGTFIEQWLKLKKPEIEQSTYARYRNSGDKFLAFLGDGANGDIAMIRKHSIAEFRNRLLEKVQPQTANLDLRFIKMIFKQAKQDGYVTESPAEGVELIRRIRTKARRPFTVEELRQVIEAADPEWGSMTKFGLYSGQRLGDLARLTWANIDLDNKPPVLRLSTKKTHRCVVIPIAPALLAHILAIEVGSPGEAIHPRLSRKPSNQLSNEFTDLLVRAGLRQSPRSHDKTGMGHDVARKPSRLSFHSLRVTATSLLKDAGVPQAVVEELIGHSSAEMSKVYTRVGIEALTRATSALPAL